MNETPNVPDPVAANELSSEAARVAAKLAQLKLPLGSQVPYRLESMFAKLEGWGANGYIKRKHKLIKNVEPLLPRMLRQGEEVLYVGKGVYTSFAEQYFMGALLANLVNQTVFVLTNLRLIMIHSNTKGQPGHTYWTIFYSQIVEFKAGWTGSTVLKLRDKTKLTFGGFERLDRKQMPAIFQQALTHYRELGFDPAVSQSRENMCSQCMELVPARQYQCSHCGTTFWTPRQIALRSLFFPSWGDFLMGHYSAAILELIGYGISWIVFVSIIMQGASKGGDGVTGAILVVAGLLVVEHTVDALMTHFVAKKGLTPKHIPH